MSKKTSRRCEQPASKTFLQWRTEEILRLSILPYDPSCDFRRLYQAVYKTSTFSESWSPRKLSPDEVKALLTGSDGKTARNQVGSPRPQRETRASSAARSNDRLRQRQKSEDSSDGNDALVGIVTEAVATPSAESGNSKDALEQVYLKMLLEKSKAIRLKQQEIQLRHRNETLGRESSLTRGDKRINRGS